MLSFNLDSGYNKNRKVLEGELVLCPNVIAKNARENKVNFSRELAFVLAHGVLHILGWRAWERKCIRICKIKISQILKFH